MDKDVFVQNVKELCLKKGVKPTNACKECGVGGSFLSDINRGQTPSVSKVETLAHYLGVTTSELLGEKKEPAPEDGSGLDAEHKDLVSLYDAASPALRTAALAVLRSAGGQVIEVEPVPIQTTVERVLAESGQLNRLEIRPSKVRKARLKILSEKLEIAQNTKGSGSGHGHE